MSTFFHILWFGILIVSYDVYGHLESKNIIDNNIFLIPFISFAHITHLDLIILNYLCLFRGCFFISNLFKGFLLNICLYKGLLFTIYLFRGFLFIICLYMGLLFIIYLYKPFFLSYTSTRAFCLSCTSSGVSILLCVLIFRGVISFLSNRSLTLQAYLRLIC